jgi:hypothetical protein
LHPHIDTHNRPAARTQYLGRKKELDRLLKDESGLILPGALYEAAECDIQGYRGWAIESLVVPAGPKGGWKTASNLPLPPYCSPPEATRVPQRVRGAARRATWPAAACTPYPLQRAPARPPLSCGARTSHALRAPVRARPA